MKDIPIYPLPLGEAEGEGFDANAYPHLNPLPEGEEEERRN